jgi:acyl-CoA synthetase (AMP-forming)/AMP-acid ligase II
LRPGCAAAFTLQEESADAKLVVVAEVQKAFLTNLDTNNHRALLAEVRAQIADLFGLRLAQLVLIRPGSIPKTSSGKLRRRHCRELLMSNRLELAEIQEAQPQQQPSVSAGLGEREATA